ncbi:MAG: site-specific integrase [Planctomycetes bacterium]|nr:site-specific integrase [Planctomycetota bacterium]
MPKLGSRVPKYRRHKASGQAVVTIAGHDHYLGKYGTKASREEYGRLVKEWEAGDRGAIVRTSDLTIAELCRAYWRFAHGYYRKDGVPTGQLSCIRNGLRAIRRTYGRVQAADFGPLALKALQRELVEMGLSRSYINQNVGVVKRMFRWAVSEEMIPPAVLHALDSVPGLRNGRTAAIERAPVAPVDASLVDATLPHLPATVADMVRLQRLTGMRPGEVFVMRPCDIDRAGEVWTYTPHSHKTQHHGRQRVVFIGPQAQKILRPYLLRGKDDYCFTPADTVRKLRDARHAARKTPLSCGNKPGTNRRKKPKRTIGARYNKDSYGTAIRRATDAAFPPPEGLDDDAVKAWRLQHRWGPNQLRHTAATEIRRQFGLEAAQVALGHSKADVTQIYAERDSALAARVAREVG